MASLVIDFELDPSLSQDQKLLRQRNGKLQISLNFNRRKGTDYKIVSFYLHKMMQEINKLNPKGGHSKIVSTLWIYKQA